MLNLNIKVKSSVLFLLVTSSAVSSPKYQGKMQVLLETLLETDKEEQKTSEDESNKSDEPKQYRHDKAKPKLKGKSIGLANNKSNKSLKEAEKQRAARLEIEIKMLAMN